MDTNEQRLKNYLITILHLPESAVQYLVELYEATQIFDDVADGDDVDREALDRVIYSTLVGIPSNPFFATYSSLLFPVTAKLVLKWQASDTVERAGVADAKSYMWRGGFFDVVMSVVTICHGSDKAKLYAPKVMAMYSETYEDYMKEFHHG